MKQPSSLTDAVAAGDTSDVAVSPAIELSSGDIDSHQKTKDSSESKVSALDEEAGASERSASDSAEKSLSQRWWVRPLLALPGQRRVRGAEDSTLSDANAVEAVKLLIVALACLGVIRLLICDAFSMECDRRYTFELFLRQDFHMVVFDLLTVFLVGRLGTESALPVDSLSFSILLFAGGLLPSIFNEIDFLQVSLSMYTVMCTWQWETFVFMSGLVLILLAIVILHLHFLLRRMQRAAQVRIVAELLVISAIFIIPRAVRPSFHAHHWYTAWLAALFCRLPRWWSRSPQAFFLGYYLNGIAVYGRDPVLMCEAAYDSAYYLGCAWFRSCVWRVGNYTAAPRFIEPNWRTCTPGHYA